jgi:benzodiazapine receptor
LERKTADKMLYTLQENVNNMSSSNEPALLRAANVVAFVLVVVVNILANLLPLNGRTTASISDSYPTLIAPAGYVFSIWGVIYALLLVFTVFQALPSQRDKPFLRQVGYFFLLSSLANVSWLFLWHYGQIVLSVLPMFVLLVSLILIYLRVQIGKSDASTVEKLSVHVPFSVYLGWITVASIANVAAAAVSLDLNGLGLGEITWTVLVIIIALIITLGVIVTRRDIAYSLVLVWALVGIVVKQFDNQSIVLTAGASATVILVVLVAVNLRSKLKRQ